MGCLCGMEILGQLRKSPSSLLPNKLHLTNTSMQHVETIWEGIVSEFSCAYDLIYIVDQVHEFTVTQHRDFVIKHLEAWHRRYEDVRKEQSEYIARAACVENLAFTNFNSLALAEWAVVKCESKDNRYRKSDLKR